MSYMKTQHETKISERIEEFCARVLERFSKPNQPMDFSEYLRYEILPYCLCCSTLMRVSRYFLDDVWSHLVYGRPRGHVAEGRDVSGYLAALRGIYSMSGYAAVMPWLMPLLRSPLWRRYFWRWTRTFSNMFQLFSVRRLNPCKTHVLADIARTLTQ